MAAEMLVSERRAACPASPSPLTREACSHQQLDHPSLTCCPRPAHYIRVHCLCRPTSPDQKTPHLVEILRNAGAVLYAETNNPQRMMVLEMASNIYRRTLNPWNTTLSAGGSSGGESTLIALHGSLPLSIASDVGGSIRIPAAFTGLTASILQVVREARAHVGLGMHDDGRQSPGGPTAARRRGDLELFFQVTLDAKPWLTEPLLAMPWTSQNQTAGKAEADD